MLRMRRRAKDNWKVLHVDMIFKSKYSKPGISKTRFSGIRAID